MEAAAPGNRPVAPLYDNAAPLRTKIETVAREVYGADGVDFEDRAVRDLDDLTAQGFGDMPVCMAKTQLSLSDDPSRLAAPRGWRLKVGSAKVSAGAGFVVVRTGSILLMPGMPKRGAALDIRMDEDGKIYGLS
jgi:formate--tetrahydrofolate ligase